MRVVLRLSILIAVIVYPFHVAVTAPIPPPQKINSESARLHHLDPKRIPDAERRPWHPAELVAILGHQSGRHWQYVDSISYSHDGKQIACLAAGRVYIWESSGLRFQTLLPIKASFIQFVAQEKALLTCSEDGTARLWNLNGANPEDRTLLRESYRTFQYLGTAASPDGAKLIAKTYSSTALSDPLFVLYDLSTSPPRRTILPIHEDLTLYNAVFSSDAKTLATLTAKVPWVPLEGMTIARRNIIEQTITIWDISGRQPKQHCVLDGKCREWDRLTFSPDGKSLVAGAKVWDLSGAKPKMRAAMTDRVEKLQPCIFSPNGRHTITTNLKDQHLHLCVCDMRPCIPRILHSVRLTVPYCSALAMNPDGKFIAVGEMNTLHVWPIKDGKIEVSSPTYGHLSDVTALSFGACGNLLASAGKDGTLRLWDLDGPRPHQRLVVRGDLNPWGGGSNPWDSIALSPDGTKLATASLKQGVTIWNVSPSGLRVLAEHKYSMPAPPDNRWGVPFPPSFSLTFTPDSKTLLVAHGTDPVKMIDLAKPTIIATELKTGQGVTYRTVAVRPVGNPQEPETIQEMKPLDVSTLALSLDGKTFAVGAGYEIEIWGRTDDGWKRRNGFWYTGSYSPRSLAFDRFGKTLLVGAACGNGELRRFDVSGEKPVQLGEPVVHDKPITSVAASPTGHFLAAADEGGRVVVWSASGEKLHEWTFPGPVRCVSFAPDGYHLALGNGDGTVYILRLADTAKR